MPLDRMPTAHTAYMRDLNDNIREKNIERNCLKWDKKFKTESRFVRMCDYCRTHSGGAMI